MQTVNSDGKALHPKCQFRSDKPWLDLQFHKGSKDQVVRPHEYQDLSRPPALDNIDRRIRNRIRGSIFGLALGDAIGAHVEFRPREFLLEHPVHDMQAGGTWGLAIGQFTDDTSMALCLACSLIARRDFVPYDQLVRYNWWKSYGYLSSTGHCFDIGRATKIALDNFTHAQHEFATENGILKKNLDYLSDEKLLQEFNTDCSEEGAAGNGSLMRLAPVPLFFYKDPIVAVQFAGISGSITHSDQQAVDACRYYAALIVAALQGKSKDEILDPHFYKKNRSLFGTADLHPGIIAISKGSYRKAGTHPKEIQGKGYVVAALEAALWAFWSDEGSFEKGVLRAVNLGDDTDTTAAIYGQLAGAFYGFDSLPTKWVDRIYAKDFLKCVSDWIAYEGDRWNAGGPEPSTGVNMVTATMNTNRGSKSRPSTSKGGFNRGSGLDGYEEYPDNQRPRRKTLHDLDQLNTSTKLSVEHEHRSKSKEPEGKERIYIHPQLKTCNDVYQHMVDKLGNQYREPLKSIELHDIDAYWLLNMVDNDYLERYGVKDANLRKKILKEANILRGECPTKYPSQN